MKTIQKTINGKYVLKSNNLTVKAMFSMGKLWLTTKDVAEVYWVSENDVKKQINNILINSNLDLSDNIQKVYNENTFETENFYSLDVLLLLWYRSKHFKETKFLVNSNKLLREHTENRQFRTGKSESLFEKFVNIFQKVA